ncbi:M20 aminoacylase family protein [Paracoccus sp. NGMCC 1.201697]|uniref:M20 aminoacylase family protein n=1 Tax=Paracoccus broussonetiae subsp. drimophilus TaxID=3373869 RepID=A0ABW7LPY2_9RHOB
MNPALTDFLPELVQIRHRLHANPELGLEEHQTSELVASCLAEWGFQVTRGLGSTGVVGTLRRGNGPGAIGLRADMDALPMDEETGLAYASKNPGRMHACGHDGHTAMLLGAAWLLAHDPDFSGTAHLIFQPAEENEGGAQMMVRDGLFREFPCDRVYALHNYPGLQAGKFAVRRGAMSASIDAATVTIHGKGGHGAFPEDTIDPIVIASSIVMALQTVVARNVSPHDRAVVTVGAIHSGTVCNIIPDSARLEISMRATDPALRTALRDKVVAICEGQAASFGASVEFAWQTGYPSVINDDASVQSVREAAIAAFGPDAVEDLRVPMMGSEDFSFFLDEVPGAYAFIGNGDSTGLHTTTYDFNDKILPIGATFLHRLVRDHTARPVPAET